MDYGTSRPTQKFRIEVVQMVAGAKERHSNLRQQLKVGACEKSCRTLVSAERTPASHESDFYYCTDEIVVINI